MFGLDKKDFNVGIFIARDTLNQADIARRNKENRRENFNRQPSSALGAIAKKVRNDCYCLKPSKEIIRELLLGIEQIRGEL